MFVCCIEVIYRAATVWYLYKWCIVSLTHNIAKTANLHCTSLEVKPTSGDSTRLLTDDSHAPLICYSCVPKPQCSTGSIQVCNEIINRLTWERTCWKASILFFVIYSSRLCRVLYLSGGICPTLGEGLPFCNQWTSHMPTSPPGFPSQSEHTTFLFQTLTCAICWHFQLH